MLCECGRRDTDGAADQASWALWAADVCAAIATRMPAGIDSERVTTPLPFAWSVFEHVSLASICDRL